MTVKEKAQISFIYIYLSSFFLTSFVKNIPFSSYALVPLEKSDVCLYVDLYMDS